MRLKLGLSRFADSLRVILLFIFMCRTSHLKPKKDKIPHLRRRQGQVDKTDVEIVAPCFLLETAGKVPRKVCAAADEYLRRQYKAGADVAPVALSFPTEGEEQLQKQLAASLRRPGGGK